ncbi:MAG: hypothetical protein Q8941_20555 [Bacteroidota bacterium]|nr:hypothetical protein [Bacteroidota bacterium]
MKKLTTQEVKMQTSPSEIWYFPNGQTYKSTKMVKGLIKKTECKYMIIGGMIGTVTTLITLYLFGIL